MGNCLMMFVVVLSIGSLAVVMGCWRCGGPFALVVHVLDFVLGGRPSR